MVFDPLQMYSSKTLKSKTIFEEAKNYIPLGVSSNYRYLDPYPLYITRGRGSKVWDTDGNEYIDFILGFGVLHMGHAHPKIVEEAKKAIEEGTIYGFEYEKTVELAKIIRHRYNVEMVRFSSTGTEATMHAIRLARAYTKRDKVIKFEGHYHGSHDSLLVNVNPMELKEKVPASLGITEETLKNTLVAEWNNLESVEKLAKENKGNIACIIMEPVAMNMGLIPPDLNFLKGVFEVAKENNILIIFDEVKTAGKFYSGASGYYNLKPDIITMGKSIAAGFPLSVIAGKREILEMIRPGVVAHGGTFNANPLAVKVSIVNLREVLTESSLNTARSLSDELSKGYEDISEDLDVDLSVTQWGPSGMIYFSKEAPRNYKEMIRTDFKSWFTYFYYMVSNGILPMAGFNEQWNVSIVHTKEEIEKHLEVAREAIKIAKIHKTGLSLFEPF